MRNILLVVILTLSFIPVYAKDPIPEALLNAKTAIVENARAEQKDIDRLTEALQKWGRFELVTDRAKADIRITLTREMREEMVLGPSGRMQNQQFLVNLINIYKMENDALLWSDKTSNYSKDPKVLVSNLKNKLKNK